jgi:hypothetical protein
LVVYLKYLHQLQSLFRARLKGKLWTVNWIRLEKTQPLLKRYIDTSLKEQKNTRKKFKPNTRKQFTRVIAKVTCPFVQSRAQPSRAIGPHEES